MDMMKYELKYWNKGIKFVAGIDEAGRGPLAGPVVASCVILSPNTRIDGVKDSKKISNKKREVLFEIIKKEAYDVSIGIANENEIDSLNILQATFLAMRRAVGNLNYKPEQLLIDGPHSDIKLISVENIIDGDNKSISIAAASIIAKVTRDRIMKEYDLIYPEYQFCNNKGYGTKYHIEALKINKATPIHRKTFKIVKSHLPTFNFYKNKNKFHSLSQQIIASDLIKKDFSLINKDLYIQEIDNFIDFQYSNNSKSIFFKIITLCNNNLFSVGKPDFKGKKEFLNFIERQIIKKESKKKFTFNVISVEFINKNKPIIKYIYSEKNH